jgi:AraC-like DNA-binding protein
MKNKTVIFIVCSPVLIFLIPMLWIFSNINHQRTEFVFFPGCQLKCQLTKYNDFHNKGISEASLEENSQNAIVLKYKLLRPPSLSGEPFAGVAVDLLKEKSLADLDTLDISSYDSVIVDIFMAKPANAFIIQLKEYTNSPPPSIPNPEECQVQIKKNIFRYSKSIKFDFTRPSFTFNASTNSQEFKKPDYKKFYGFSFQTGTYTSETVPAYFIISKISFVKNCPASYPHIWHAWLIFIFCVLLYIGIAYFFIFRKLKIEGISLGKGWLLKGKRKDNESQVSEEQIQDLTNYTNEHFTDPKLDLSLLSNSFGISITVIKNVFLSRYKKTFTDYRDEIRVKKAQEILKNNPHKILKEVAKTVGFSHQESFTRAFEKVYKENPSVFQENLKKQVP